MYIYPLLLILAFACTCATAGNGEQILASKNVQTFFKFLTIIQYPNPLPFKENGTLPTDIWAPNVVGRLMGAINLNDEIQGSSEYFMGLTPTNPETGYIVSKQVIHHMIEDHDSKTLAVTYDLVFFNSTKGKKVPLTQILWAHFDENHLID